MGTAALVKRSLISSAKFVWTREGQSPGVGQSQVVPMQEKFAGRLVAFGGCGDGVHAPDEFVEVQDFYDHMDIVAYALYRLRGGE